MDTFLPKSLDALLRSRPFLMWSCAVALAVLACWAVIGAGNNLLVYEGF